MSSTPSPRTSSWTRATDWPAALAGATTRQLVLGAGTLMIALQLGFRAWALYPSWFYTDDYHLLADATGHAPSWAYLSAPFDSQFMPLGRLVVWLVAHAGHLNWALAASSTLLVQAAASVACLWMLTTLFGYRAAILAPLGLYLFLAMTMPALMWWAAALNQLPLQLVLFASVAAWTRYLRTSRVIWLVVTVAWLALGLLAYVKTVLVLGVLAYLLVAYFSEGPALPRVRQALRRAWPGLLAAAVLALVYTVYYTTQVPQVFVPTEHGIAGDLADQMLGTSLSTGVVGGPWRWNDSNPPVGLADPPDWTVHLAWVLLALAALGAALRRHRTGRAWLLLLLYVGASYVLLLTSRAPLVGAIIGLEYRYLTDAVPLLALCLGLITMPVVGATESSRARTEPLLTRIPGRRWQVAALVAVCVSGLVSSRAYALLWHDDNPGDDYVHRAADGLRGKGTVDLADQKLPPAVIPAFSFPYNTTRLLLPLITGDVRFPRTTDNLVVLTDGGTPTRALIDAAARTAPGPDGDCGWKVRATGRSVVPLQATSPPDVSWLRIGYLGSAADTVRVGAGATTVEAPVARGLHSLYVHVTGPVSSVTFTDLAPGTILCVDTIEVGQPVPGASL